MNFMVWLLFLLPIFPSGTKQGKLEIMDKRRRTQKKKKKKHWVTKVRSNDKDREACRKVNPEENYRKSKQKLLGR
jgi:hypothetical protein